MSDSLLTAEEIFLRQNAPHILEEMTAKQVEHLTREGKTEELAEFLRGRAQIDKLWKERGASMPEVRLWNERPANPKPSEMTDTAKARTAASIGSAISSLKPTEEPVQEKPKLGVNGPSH